MNGYVIYPEAQFAVTLKQAREYAKQLSLNVDCHVWVMNCRTEKRMGTFFDGRRIDA